MPLSKAGKKIKAKLEKQYGEKKGEGIFYAMENKGEIPGMNKMKSDADGGMMKMVKGYVDGGMVKSTGKMNTGIKKCGE